MTATLSRRHTIEAHHRTASHASREREKERCSMMTVSKSDQPFKGLQTSVDEQRPGEREVVTEKGKRENKEKTDEKLAK